MFNDLPPEENDIKSRMILEHELRAAIRIIGWFVEQQGGHIEIPHQVLATDYRVSVHSPAGHPKINLKSRIHEPERRR